MSAPVACFWLEPTDRVRLALRRYREPTRWDEASQAVIRPDRSVCALPHGYHNAQVPIGEAPARLTERGTYTAPAAAEYDGDPHWPTHCACGEAFESGDRWQVFTELIYRRADTGAEVTLRASPPGAMWDACWYPWKGPDGRSLMVVCPDGYHWNIDGEASNCTLPDDKEHRCWLRTGEPPKITVGKSAPGQRTCAAGAGSIGTPKWHGFLRDGFLVVA